MQEERLNDGRRICRKCISHHKKLMRMLTAAMHFSQYQLDCRPLLAHKSSPKHRPDLVTQYSRPGISLMLPIKL